MTVLGVVASVELVLVHFLEEEELSLEKLVLPVL